MTTTSLIASPERIWSAQSPKPSVLKSSLILVGDAPARASHAESPLENCASVHPGNLSSSAWAACLGSTPGVDDDLWNMQDEAAKATRRRRTVGDFTAWISR